ncbi:hypothetical protein HY641_00225 [Candidatus Woesearchaeota archaeon]|nr:hypothetical protein [Candidatus Woesearchaeota archaeon]
MAKKESSVEYTFNIPTLVLIALFAGIIIFNQYQIMTFGISGPGTFSLSGRTNLALPPGSQGTTLGPVFNSDGRTTSVKELPTISATPDPAPSGDPVQDAINRYVPTGTPEYGAALGVSFDDPINSLNKLARYDQTEQLDTPEEKARYDKLAYGFSCDFCCGGPNSVTHISNCGCSHAAAWRGVFKYFIKNNPEYTDEQLIGEATRWKTLWYPGPMMKRILSEGSSGSVDASTLSQLPGMVGGC